MMPAVHLIPGRETRPELYRWGCSLAIVLLAHIAATAGFMRWDSFAMPPDPQVASAVMVDLAPAPVAPESEPVDTPPEPEPVMAEPPPEPEPMPEIESQPQELLPPPPPEEPERDMVFDSPAEPAPATTAPPSASAPPAQTVAAPMAGVSSPQNADPVQTWQARLLAQLELHKRYPRQALLRHQQGVPYLRFFLDHEGKVVRYKLERSSGNTALDQEALALLQRAQPLPPPPAEVAQALVELVVPIEFTIH